MTRAGTYRYARVTEINRWLAAGWIDCGPCPGHHGYWSHLMRACECNPEGRKP